MWKECCILNYPTWKCGDSKGSPIRIRRHIANALLPHPTSHAAARPAEFDFSIVKRADIRLYMTSSYRQDAPSIPVEAVSIGCDEDRSEVIRSARPKSEMVQGEGGSERRIRSRTYFSESLRYSAAAKLCFRRDSATR